MSGCMPFYLLGLAKALHHLWPDLDIQKSALQPPCLRLSQAHLPHTPATPSATIIPPCCYPSELCVSNPSEDNFQPGHTTHEDTEDINPIYRS